MITIEFICESKNCESKKVVEINQHSSGLTGLRDLDSLLSKNGYFLSFDEAFSDPILLCETCTKMVREIKSAGAIRTSDSLHNYLGIKHK
uniref:Uncharacterized protein n=1 Tax=viral metagenome TaxID=1070528 RepID=A0A6M3JYB2_9ZZZZ